jgi:GTP:adenosylcobinamide-phosphate guanylyltransferase
VIAAERGDGSVVLPFRICCEAFINDADFETVRRAYKTITDRIFLRTNPVEMTIAGHSKGSAAQRKRSNRGGAIPDLLRSGRQVRVLVVDADLHMMAAVANLAVENGIGQLHPRLPKTTRFAQNRLPRKRALGQRRPRL